MLWARYMIDVQGRGKRHVAEMTGYLSERRPTFLEDCT